MESVSPLRSKGRSERQGVRLKRTVFPCSHCRACAEYIMVIWNQNSSAPYPNNPLRDGDGDAFIDVSSFILFFSSVFSSFTVCISSSISVSLVLNSSTNLCRFCSISNVFVLVLTAATAAIDDAVGTPMAIDIQWNEMEWNEIIIFNFYRAYYISSWSAPSPVPSPSYSSSPTSIVAYSLTGPVVSSKSLSQNYPPTINSDMPRLHARDRASTSWGCSLVSFSR